jgi:pimeloyl-ACP methyl ester carboxylesterase
MTQGTPVPRHAGSPRPGLRTNVAEHGPAQFLYSRDRTRRLAVEVTGAPDGLPVFLLHGTPGSRIGPKPRGGMLYRQGVKLISYDRPGYGASTRQPDRLVRDAADDVAVIADQLGIDRFAVVGRSGGGPHALACAALLPDRVLRTVALVSIAPSEAPDLNWFEGMNEQNTEEYRRAEQSESDVLASLTASADEAYRDPRGFMDSLLSEISERDRMFVGDVALRRLLRATYTEALRQGPLGWYDDVMAFRRPWGVDLAQISTPVLLWHGAQDRYSPAQHTLWLAAKVPGAQVHIQKDVGHFEAMRVLPDILSWLTDDSGATFQPQESPEDSYPPLTSVPYSALRRDPAGPAPDALGVGFAAT